MSDKDVKELNINISFPNFSKKVKKHKIIVKI